MIRFEFELSEIDAENFMQMLDMAINHAVESASDAQWDGKQEEAEWFWKHAEYLRGLKLVVAKGSTRV